MGRLFWKFFIFFWLAQLLTVIGVGFAMWISNNSQFMHGNNMPPTATVFNSDIAIIDKSIMRPPPPGLPLMPILTGSIVSLGFAGLLAWYFSRPIRKLRTAFAALADGQLDVRIGKALSSRRDELSDLGTDFDRMAEQLKKLIEGQRRLLHDVSHELRSPLARLQAATDLMEQQPDRSKEFIECIHRDTDHMDNLVGELLALARLNGGVTENLTAKVDVGDIIADVADRTQLEFEKQKCQLKIQYLEPIALLANRDLVDRALENIVRNAIRYSPVGGRVSIIASHDKPSGQAIVSVSDEGPGVHDVNLEEIFTPFTRSEKTDWFSGFGLGLAITRRIVESHSGTVKAFNRPEGGLQIDIRLPLYKEAQH